MEITTKKNSEYKLVVIFSNQIRCTLPIFLTNNTIDMIDELSMPKANCAPPSLANLI